MRQPEQAVFELAGRVRGAVTLELSPFLARA
jgi:hypothetical protein